jgi:hypothetical protein
MFVTSAEQRAGLLVAVVSGSRPRLMQRPTRKFLDGLRDAGFPTIWSVDERDAPGYERDSHEVSIYPHDWAYEYARQHWMQPIPPDPDGFLGAFPGREWAALEAERRGCWGWMNLDDNILQLGFRRGAKAGKQLIDRHGGMAVHADLLSVVTLSTNAFTTGANLEAVYTHDKDSYVTARAGFPYSCFVERVGPGREPWVGPFEDDIIHALQYGDRADGVTAGLVPALLYKKEPTSKTGFRAHYDSTRSVQLQRLMPQGAKVGIKATKSNGRGGPRVFHTMAPIRNPLRVRDRAFFKAFEDRLWQLTAEWFVAEKEGNRAKVMKRLGEITK